MKGGERIVGKTKTEDLKKLKVLTGVNEMQRRKEK
jgi:hypothetical protein